MTDEQLDARFKDLEDRLVRFMAQEFESVRREFESVRGEISRLERRVGYLGELTSAVVKQNATYDGDMAQVRGSQAGQQRVIEDLDRRVRRLEEKNGNPPKP